MPDPLADLRIPLTPMSPRPEFARALRQRLEAELRGTPDPERTPPMTITEMHVHLISRDARASMRFMTDAFGAVEEYRLDMPDGRIGHAEMLIGTYRVALGDPFPDEGFHAPTDAVPPVSFTLMVDDCDAAVARAVEAGATVEREPADQFYGHRTGVIRDPGGHRWMLQQVLQEMTPSEMEAAMNAGESES